MKVKLLKYFFFLVFAIKLSSCAFAQYESADELIKAGLSAYSENGAKSAIEAWIKGSGLEGSKEALSQANSINQVEEFYGTYIGYDIIRKNELSERSKIICFAINYQKGVLYGRFQVYRDINNKWVATEFKFHTEAINAFPPDIVFDYNN